jgi:hypothetical protein
MSRVAAYEGHKLGINYPTQLACHLIEVSAQRKEAVTETIREYLTAARTLGGAPLLTHERLAWLAHRKHLGLHAIVGDALERSAQHLPDPTSGSVPARIREYSPDEVAALLKEAKVASSQVRDTGVRFAPMLPLQEVAHLQHYATTLRYGLAEAARDKLEFWRSLGGISLQAHRRIAAYAESKSISLESAVANLLTEAARQHPDPDPKAAPLYHGLVVLPLDNVLAKVAAAVVRDKKAKAKSKAG